MKEVEDIDMMCLATQFCVSFKKVETAAVGIQRFVDSWNCHTISGR